jgi:hypothetical protein
MAEALPSFHGCSVCGRTKSADKKKWQHKLENLLIYCRLQALLYFTADLLRIFT